MTPPREPTPKFAGSRVVAGAGLVALVAALGMQCLVAARGWSLPGGQHWVDLDIYLASAQRYADTGQLYCLQECRELGFTYPPGAVVPLLGLVQLPVTLVRVLVTALTLSTLVAALAVIFALGRMPRPAIPWALAAVTASEPARMTVGQGQVSVVVACLALLGLALARPAAGGLLALAAATKLTPALMALPLLGHPNPRERRRLLIAIVTAATLLGAGLLLGPRLTWDYLTKVLPDTSRVGALDSISNISVAGLLAHWRVGDPWPTLAAGGTGLVLLALLVRRARGRTLDDSRDRVLVAVAGGLITLAVTPVAWTHHALFAPVAACLAIQRRRTAYRLAGLVCLALWMPPLMHIALDHFGRPASALVQSLRPLSLLVLFALAVADIAGTAVSTGERA